jgi:hypothetical protein
VARRAANIKVGDVIDGWVVESKLGGGGSSTVWTASHPEHRKAALKVLKGSSNNIRQRFTDEVNALQTIGDHPGVLSLVATNALTTPTPPTVWLATRVAEGVRDALGTDPELATVVAAVHEYAQTFADLASKGFHHRDVKPENLFRLGGAWVVGDFGLVDYPGKIDITAPGRKLGPLFYRAPEMLRNPDTADPGPADVYSLAKTLWALAAGQNFPPDGQIMSDVEMHSLSYWLAGQGSIALQLILETATADAQDARPSMAEFAQQLADWSSADARREDQAARSLHEQYVHRLGKSLAGSLDVDEIDELEASARAMFKTARESIAQNARDEQRIAQEEAERSKQAFLQERGMSGALHINDTVWVGSMRDGDDVVQAVVAQPVEQRDADMFRGWQTLMGRPLMWMNCVALIGTLQLRGVEGCDPRATDMARRLIRDHLLGFPDDPRLADAWRRQRALIRCTVRVLGFAPLDARVQYARDILPIQMQVRYGPRKSQIMMNLTDSIVGQRLRQVQWTAEGLASAADEAEEALAAIPTPPADEWEGPVTDPWLGSWDATDPLVQCGVGILWLSNLGDDLIRSDGQIIDALRNQADHGARIDSERAAGILARVERG